VNELELACFNPGYIRLDVLDDLSILDGVLKIDDRMTKHQPSHDCCYHHLFLK
jgi:hypothetical protein